MENIDMLKGKLAKEKDKKARIEQNIKRLEEKIEQAETSQVKALMKEYDIDIATLSELLKQHGDIGELVENNENF